MKDCKQFSVFVISREQAHAESKGQECSNFKDCHGALMEYALISLSFFFGGGGGVIICGLRVGTRGLEPQQGASGENGAS